MSPASGLPAAELLAVVGAPHLVTGEGRLRYRIGGAVPRGALQPADAGEVERILALAWRDGLGVVPWGGGFHQGIGRPPARYDLALDLARLDRVIDHQPGDMTVTVQAGLTLEALAALLGRHGQHCPLDPPPATRATVGGVLATNLSGPLRCRYGTARDLVLGLRIAHANGTRSVGGGRVVKNATAYDIPKLYLGALGTLGVIVEATVRVYPRPPADAGEIIAFPDLSAAAAMADRLLHSSLVPTRLELLDGGGGRGIRLLVTLAGVPEAVAFQQNAVAEMAAVAGGKLQTEQLPADLDLLGEFPWGADTGRGDGVLWRGGVRVADCARAMAAVRGVAGMDVSSEAAATVSAGTLRGRLSGGPEALCQAALKVRTSLEGLGGYLVVLEAPPAVRTALDVWGSPPGSLHLMQQLRQAFDGRRILNPGRFLESL
ncbi:MAG: FAD-binding oxidoreductase [Candidatus Methylomirabilota bacterium]